MTKHLGTMGALAVAGVLAAGIASVWGHHATSMFDHSTTMTINGEVVELRWVNPHVSHPAISCVPAAGGATQSSLARKSR
jgi:hypothetical protein